MTDIGDSIDFYQSRPGQRTLKILQKHVADIWPELSGRRVLSVAQGSLLLGPANAAQASRMTSVEEQPFSCLVDAQNKPLPDADFDRIILLHAAKSPFDLERVLREAWRVLKGEGKLLIAVPRQHSKWAEKSETPFGFEAGYSPAQIKKMLRKHGFRVDMVCRALYAAPCGSEHSLLSPLVVEATLRRLHLGFGGGVLLVEARKRIYGTAGSKPKKRHSHADPLFPMPLPI